MNIMLVFFFNNMQIYVALSWILPNS